MGFKTKTDIYGVADASTVVCTSVDDGRTAQEVTAQGADGSIVASEVFGESCAPSCGYAVKADVSWADAAKKLGKVSTFDTTHKAALTKIEIVTAAGAAPTISASGEQVEDAAVDGSLYSLPATALSAKHVAQTLWSAFTLGGTGCHLTGATYTAECTITKATKDGSCLAFDVSAAKLAVAVTVKQTGDTAPTLSTTAQSGWTVTAPLTCSNPDADYPTFSATLTKYLTKDVATVQG